MKQNGLSVVAAIPINSSYIVKYHNYYMIFDYFDGQILTDDSIDYEKAREIGDILAKMHNMDYRP